MLNFLVAPQITARELVLKDVYSAAVSFVAIVK